jgi:formylglycine-generating enzyme required for sulfatase activity
VSWNDAVAFCGWLSRKEGKKYRLPTEAEWEYACRAGTATRYWCGNDAERLADIANTGGSELSSKFGGGPAIAANDGYVFTSPVGSFRANPFGLCDMHGNAWQWCADRWKANYYGESPIDDPKGPDSGDRRVLRGGSWNFGPVDCRCSQRIALSADCRNDFTGFRIVMEK